jgi:glycosyltransferase involved in cell wall biosynthesis
MAVSEQRKILFVHGWLSSFIRYDLEILRQKYKVTELPITLRQACHAFLIPGLVWRHDLVFGWFASWHTLGPMLCARGFTKPSVLVIGGYDLASLPEIGYGYQQAGLNKWITRLTIRMATRLVTHSEYSRSEARQNVDIPKEQVQVIYLGVPDPFGALSENPRDPIVLTVGFVKRSNLRRKGHEAFVKAASLLPDAQFVLIGDWEDDAIEYLQAIAPVNMIFTGWLDDSALVDYYSRASVYVQASLHEGFGLSVAEAMLAGCIPVVTRAGALPEVVGDVGVYLPSSAPEAIAKGVQTALTMDSHHRRQARERIIHRFPLQNRRQQLFDLIDDLLAATQ